MENVVEQDWFFFVCDSDQLTLVGVKRHYLTHSPRCQVLKELTEGPDNLSGLKR